MNHEVQSEVFLDERQRAVADDFATYVEALEEVREKSMLKEFPSDFARRICANILELQRKLSHISEGVHTISTATGTVNEGHSFEYLQQELKRRRLITQLQDWHLSNIRLRMGNSMFGHQDTITRHKIPKECIFCVNSIEVLEADLSALTDDEKCRRACMILASIKRNRPRIGSALLAPVMISREIGALLLAGVAAVGSFWGTVPSLAGAGIEIGHRHLQNRKKAKELADPEADCIAIIRKHLQSNRQHVLFCLAEARLSGTPEDIVHATPEEIFSGL